MKIFSRYDLMVLRLTLPVLLGVLLPTSLILVYSQTERTFMLFEQDAITFFELSYLIMLQIGQVQGYLFPIALLLSTLWMIHGLLTRHELLILQFLGLGAGRICRTIFVLALFFTSISFIYSVFFSHTADHSLRVNSKNLSQISARHLLEEGKYRQFGNDSVIYIRHLEGNSVAKGIFYYEAIEDSQVILLAERMAEQDHVLRLYKGQQIWGIDGKHIVLSYEWAEPNLSGSIATNFVHRKRISEWSSATLWENRDLPVAQVEFHRRLTEPMLSVAMACLIYLMVMIGKGNEKKMRRVTGFISFTGAVIIYAFILAKSAASVPYIWLSFYALIASPMLLVLFVILYRRWMKWRDSLSFTEFR